MAHIGIEMGRVGPLTKGRLASSQEHLVAPYVLALPLLYLLGFWAHVKKTVMRSLRLTPQHNAFIVDGVSVNSRRMKEGATRWPSLDACYNFTTGEGATMLHRAIDSYWMRIRNAQAVRNRLKLAKIELRAAIEKRARPGEPVRILSLASGSAQGVIEVAAEMRRRGVTVEVLLVDQDVTALNHARKLASHVGVSIRAEHMNALKFDRVLDGFKADVVEMMGFLDYLRDTLAEKMLRKIRLYMQPGSIFLCCHIHPNAERYFLKHVVEWDSGMLYRSVVEFEDLLVKNHFLTPRLVTEAHGIHSVSVAEKD